MDSNDIFPFQNYRVATASDGIVVHIAKETVKTKKNRRRHIKDGAPKKMRGKGVWEVVANEIHIN